MIPRIPRLTVAAANSSGFLRSENVFRFPSASMMVTSLTRSGKVRVCVAAPCYLTKCKRAQRKDQEKNEVRKVCEQWYISVPACLCLPFGPAHFFSPMFIFPVSVKSWTQRWSFVWLTQPRDKTPPYRTYHEPWQSNWKQNHLLVYPPSILSRLISLQQK